MDIENNEGIVIKSTGSWYKIVEKKTRKEINCKIAGKLRTEELKTTNPVVVGDNIFFKYLEEDNVGVITDIKERKNYIVRKSSNLSKQVHIIAANIDLALLMITLKHPVTTIEFIDRFLVTAEAYRIPVVLLFNKMDLYDKKILTRLKELTEIYSQAGYTYYQLSLIQDTGLEEIEKTIKDKVTLISGNSGVGKTTLINKLQPGLQLKTKEISEYHKLGKHATTYAEMFEISKGTFIIDTPGLKGFGLVYLDKNELFHFFPEIFKLSANCKFYNCTHSHEPGCAVIEGVKQNIISQSRYRSYLNMFNEDKSKYR